MIQAIAPQLSGSVQPCWAQDMAALGLARDLADLLDAPLDEVWFSLYNSAAECPPLLHSPEGWAILASLVGRDLGFSLPAYSVQVH